MSQGEIIVTLLLGVLIVGVVAALAAQTVRRKIAERAFAELQRAIASTGAATWSIDAETGAMRTSPAFSEMLGLGSERNLSREFHDQLIHPEDRESYREAVRARTNQFEYRLRHADGRYLWVHCRAGLAPRIGSLPARFVGAAVDVSQRHAAAAELSRSQETLRLAMDASQAGYFDLEGQSGPTYWSPRALEILGRDESSAPSTAILPTLVHPDDLREFLAEREESRLTGRPLDIEVRLRHEAGHYIWAHLRAIPQANGDRPTGRVIGLIRDVSQRRRTEAAVHASEKKYRDLIDGSIQAILILDRLTPVFCNRACANLFGYESAEDLVARGTITPHLTSEARDGFEQIWAASMRGENDGLLRRRQLVNLQGKRVDVEIIGRRIDWDGKPAWQVTMFDSTARSRMERELRASEERFRLLTTNSSDVIIVYDGDNIVSYASPSLEQVSGYRPEEIVGRTGLDIIHPDDLPGLIERRSELRSGVRKPAEATRFRIVRKDGGIRWIEATNSVLPSKDGLPPDIVSASRDITGRVEREIELKTAHGRLEAQAKDLALLAQNLEAERERSEQANAAKSQFLAMMSHELRTPMTGVLGMADLLRATNLNDEQRGLTQLLTRSARTLLDLLNDILDFSKVEAGQLQIENTAFKLSDVIADVNDLFAPAASEKGLTLKSRLPENFCDSVVGDPKRMRQVLANLVNNAIKFTERGGVTISLSQADEGDGLFLSVSVSDTGIGIADEDRGRLFAPFIQADVSTSRKFGGTGLGLAICKRLVEAMGGSIDVDSKPGKGARFTFSMRLRRADASEAAPSGSMPEEESKSVRPQPRRILLAEDNDTSRFLISTMLQRKGHTVEAVENGALAVAAATHRDFDIILMDMQMPVMDGPDATREIRKLPPLRGGIPIVALTADVIAEHRKYYLAAGANVVVGKPVDWNELDREIERNILAAPNGCAHSQESAPPAHEADGNLVDEGMLAVLAESLGDDVLASMIDGFLSNVSQYRTDLHAATSSGDLKKAKRVAHALKGLCAQFGTPRAASLARFVEDQAKSMNDVAPLLGDLDATVAATNVAFGAHKHALMSRSKAG